MIDQLDIMIKHYDLTLRRKFFYRSHCGVIGFSFITFIFFYLIEEIFLTLSFKLYRDIEIFHTEGVLGFIVFHIS